MRAQKRDYNEREIIDAMKAMGCHVEQSEGGDGRPDLLVAVKCRTAWVLCRMEVKMPGKTLNALQKKYHAGWPGPIHLVRTTMEAIMVVRHYMEGTWLTANDTHSASR